MRNTLLAAIAAAFVLCGGCARDIPADNESNNDSAAAPPTLPVTSSSPAATTSSPPPGPPRSPRGNLIKAFGEEAGYCSATTECNPSNVEVTFAIDSVTVNPKCDTGFAHPPENGTLLAVALRVATATTLPPDLYTSFSAFDFQIIGQDGLTVSNLATAATYSCLNPSETFTSGQLRPGQKYAGTILLDSPSPTGTLIYAPANSSIGWEWQF
jgi:hypothetical protein